MPKTALAYGHVGMGPGGAKIFRTLLCQCSVPAAPEPRPSRCSGLAWAACTFRPWPWRCYRVSRLAFRGPERVALTSCEPLDSLWFPNLQDQPVGVREGVPPGAGGPTHQGYASPLGYLYS